MKQILIILACMLCLTACRSSYSTVAHHLEEMNKIAVSNSGQCDEMVRLLNAYLDKNEDSFRRAVATLDGLEPSDAIKIAESTSILDETLHACPNDVTAPFLNRLSKVLFIEAAGRK